MLNEKENLFYEKWLSDNDYEESVTAGSSSCIFKKEYWKPGNYAWKDETGKEYPALSNQKIWEGGFDVGASVMINKIHNQEFNNQANNNRSILFELTADDLKNILYSIKEKFPGSNLEERLTKADNLFRTFENGEIPASE